MQKRETGFAMMRRPRLKTTMAPRVKAFGRTRREHSEADLLKWPTLENGRVAFYNEDGFENRLRQRSHEIHLKAGKSRSLGLRGELSCKIAGQRSGRLRVLSVLINYNAIS